MKKLYFLLYCLPLQVIAQPVLKSNEVPMNMPIQFTVGANVPPGPSGENIVWDFSSIPVSNGGTFERVDPSTTPYYSIFPNCNNVQKISSSITFYNYYYLSNTKSEWVGVRWGSATGSVNVNLTKNPATLLKFPFAYKESIIDTVESNDGTILEVDTLIYDGYGTIKTPYATYNSAVRIKTIAEDKSETYDWYIATPGFPTLSIFQIDNGQKSTRIFNYSPTDVKNVVKTGLASIAPNPVHDNLHVDNTNATAIYVIYNSLGQKIDAKFIAPSGDIDVSNLATNQYILQIVDANGLASYRFIKE